MQQKSYGFNLILLGDFNAHLSEINLQQRLNKRRLKVAQYSFQKIKLYSLLNTFNFCAVKVK